MQLIVTQKLVKFLSTFNLKEISYSTKLKLSHCKQFIDVIPVVAIQLRHKVDATVSKIVLHCFLLTKRQINRSNCV